MSQTPQMFTGPGSQPSDEDGAELSYMPMPSEMMTFSAQHLPEKEDIEGLDQGIAALDAVLGALGGYKKDAPADIVDLSGLTAENLELINQVLGEGEVSVVAGTTIQAQEAV
ncbi:MAG: hydrogenase expression/formation protein, partial [Hyphomicrobiaceae bacterium]|nr:hydrogenase expression/formation protein [Hyphomicrobiaceae bacterium]